MNEPEPNDRTRQGSSPVGSTTVHIVINQYPFLSPKEESDEIGRLGNYRVLKLLGSGGMGYVFEAEELTLHRRVALKVLKPELAKEAENRERFLREARAAAAINSDHVVTIYQISDGDPPFLAMQFLEGESLQDRVERPNSITLRTALEITRQTAEGLACAHALGLIHRDVKPANLWLETRPDLGKQKAEEKPSILRPAPTTTRVKILDFGLARRTTGETSLTSTGFIVGTPNFMSPEQASGHEVDGRADLFSLGCVLYVLLTGELPFPGGSAMAVMMALANKTPTAVNLKNPGVPVEVAEFVACLLEKDPAKRPQSAREVVGKLDEFLAGAAGNSLLLLPGPSTTEIPVVPSSGNGETVSAGKSETWPPAAPTVPPADSRRATKARSRWSPVKCALVAAIAFLTGLLTLQAFRTPPMTPEPIVVGVLHSESGRLTMIEKPVIDSTLLAIEELNAQGGILGRQIKVVVADGKSDPDEFARGAEKLLTQDKVAVIFGCSTGTNRRMVRPIVERNNGLLLFPFQTEGLELSPRIVYLGPTPNQQLIPAIDFLTDTLHKKRVYVVGSDSVFARTLSQIVSDHLGKKAKAGSPVTFVGETFIPVGSNNAFPAVNQIQITRADAIVNAIYGNTNIDFFRDLRKMGYKPDEVITLSVSITQNEVKGMNPATLAGDYLAASYFQGIDRPEGAAFVQKLKAKYGPDTIVSDPMGAAYGAVNLWAKTVKEVGTPDPTAVLSAIRGQEFEGPRARVRIDAATGYTWLPARIGKIRPDSELDLVSGAGFDFPIAPIPYPDTRTPEKWDEFLKGLNFKWNGKWQSPN